MVTFLTSDFGLFTFGNFQFEILLINLVLCSDKMKLFFFLVLMISYLFNLKFEKLFANIVFFNLILILFKKMSYAFLSKCNMFKIKQK